MIRFCPLFSGSSGNCAFVSDGKTRILIDAGRSGIQIEEALKQIGEDPKDLNAILVTHEHSDHIKGVGILSRRFNLPVYASQATWQAMPAGVGTIPPGMRRMFNVGEDFYIGHLGVDSFSIPHDAVDPCGYRLWSGQASVSVLTDLGYIPPSVMDAVSGSSLMLLESNYDPDMLRSNEHYRYALKQRILSRKGHLSNQDCAEGILRFMELGTRYFILGHLSGENNTPETAMRTNTGVLALEGVKDGVDVHLSMAWRDHVSDLFELKEN